MSKKKRSGEGILWGIRALALVAGAVSLLLLWWEWTGKITSLVGCGGEGGCANLLGGRWSKWFGLPVAAGALPLYIILFGATFRVRFPKRPERQPADRASLALLFGAIVVAGAALWFLFLALVVEREFCPYCVTVHTCGLLVAVLTLKLRPRLGVMRWQPPLMAGVGVLAVLVAGQVFGPVPDSDLVVELDPTAMVGSNSIPAEAPSPNVNEEEPQERIARYFGGQLEIPVHEEPHLGSLNADHVVVEVFDYTCASCRTVSADMKEALKRYPGQLCFVTLPCPLNRACNRYMKPSIHDHAKACEFARLALAVWRGSPRSFPEFHEWLFANAEKATPEQVRNKAVEMVGVMPLGAAENDPWIEQKLQRNTRMFGVLSQQRSAMPKMLLGDARVMMGVSKDTDTFCRRLEEAFGLTAPAAGGER